MIANGEMAGIMFQDITPLFLQPKAFKDSIDIFIERYQGKNISVVAGKTLRNRKKKCNFAIFFLELLKDLIRNLSEEPFNHSHQASKWWGQ